MKLEPTPGIMWGAPASPPIAKPRRGLAYSVAALGGAVAVLVAWALELVAGCICMGFLFAPLIEELLKPVGLFFVLEKRPNWFGGRLSLVLCSLLAAACFASIENAMFLQDAFAAPSTNAGFIMYRLTICTGLHLLASGIVGIGLAMQYHPGRRHLTMRTVKLVPFIVAAWGVHLFFNYVVNYMAPFSF